MGTRIQYLRRTKRVRQRSVECGRSSQKFLPSLTDLATHRLSVFFSVSNCVLVNIQDALEDPFDGDTADDISLAIFEPSWAFWKSGEEIFRRDIVSEYQKSSSRPAARAA